MATNGCQKCGCEDGGYTSNTPNPDLFVCSDPNKCEETYDSCCTIYTGDTILDTGVLKGDNFCNIVQIMSLWATNPSCMGLAIGCKSPINFASTAITSTTISLTWASQPNSTCGTFQVEYKLPTDITWTSLTAVPNTQFSETITGLTPNTSYYVRVKCICLSNCYSVTLMIKTKPTP